MGVSISENFSHSSTWTECIKVLWMEMNLADVEKLKTSSSRLSSLWISVLVRETRHLLLIKLPP